MKSAILISGHIRTWNITKKSFMENLYLPIIKTTNITPDIYIYTYNKLDSTVPKEIKKYSEKECADRIELTLGDDEIKDMFKTRSAPAQAGSGLVRSGIVGAQSRLDPTRASSDFKDLNVVRIEIDKTDRFECSFTNSQDYAIYNQFRMLYLCNQLKNERNTTLLNGGNKHYDFVIRTRFDLFYNFSPDTIVNFIRDFKKETLYISQDLAPGVTNDMFAISDEKTMDNYCSKFLMFQNTKNISLENSETIDSAHSLFDKNVKGLKLEKIFKTELCRPLYKENKLQEQNNLLIIFGKIPDTNWDKCSALDIPCKDVVLFLYDSYENSKKYIDKLIEQGKNIKFIKFLDNKNCVCYTEWFNIINLGIDLTEYNRIIKIIPNLKFREIVNYNEDLTLKYESEGKEITTSIFYSLKSEDFKRMINEAKNRIDKSKYLNLDEFYEEICKDLLVFSNKKKFSLIDVVYDVWTDF